MDRDEITLAAIGETEVPLKLELNALLTSEMDSDTTCAKPDQARDTVPATSLAVIDPDWTACLGFEKMLRTSPERVPAYLSIPCPATVGLGSRVGKVCTGCAA